MEQVLGYLAEHRQQRLSRLNELLRFESIANRKTPDGCRPCAEWLARTMTAMGLDAEVLDTDGQPCVLARSGQDPDRPTLLVYTHYDVQPPDPLGPWQSPPFEPTIRDGYLYARGASDDKGQLFTHLLAIEAYLQTLGHLPVNVKLLVEGEEEIGSPNIENFFRDHADRLQADALCISDVGFFAESVPSITTGLRGLCYFELTVSGPNRDVHSGLEGGLLANPVNGLATLIASLHDQTGRVTIPGFYDAVRPVSDELVAEWTALPFEADAHAAQLGVATLAGGETDLPPLVRNWARPTLDCNGIVGGYIEPGSKTIIPAEASAKISMRLVADQDPHAIAESFKAYVAEHTPAGLSSEVTVNALGRPVLLPDDTPPMQAARAAMADSFGRDPVMIRNGASIPITEVFQRVLGLDGVIMGITLPDDNLHSPNERVKLDQLWRGAEMAARFYANLAGGP
jgi:acetylornithine deacetylase/succinyl-diaminopimelate desuccinylase-like protein